MINESLSLQHKNCAFWPYASLFVLLIFISWPCFAISSKKQKIGTTSQSVNFVVELGQSVQLQAGDTIFFNDSIQTNEESFAEFEFSDGSFLTMGPESNLILDEFVYDAKTSSAEGTITIISGFLNFIGSKKSKSLKFAYKDSILGVRGTELSIFVDEENRLYISIYEGVGILADYEGTLYSLVEGTGISLNAQTGQPKSNPKIIDTINQKNIAFRGSNKLIKFEAKKAFEDNRKLNKYTIKPSEQKLQILGKIQENALGSDAFKTRDAKLTLINSILKETTVSLRKPIMSKALKIETVEWNTGPTEKNGVSFSEKFKAERAKQGPGGSFVFEGKEYSTDLASDVKIKHDSNSKQSSTGNKTANSNPKTLKAPKSPLPKINNQEKEVKEVKEVKEIK